MKGRNVPSLGAGSTSILTHSSPAPLGCTSEETHPIHSEAPLPAARTRPIIQAVLQKLLSPYIKPPYKFASTPSLATAASSFSNKVDIKKWLNPSPGRIKPLM
jgi:hypothetical protein